MTGYPKEGGKEGDLGGVMEANIEIMANPVWKLALLFRGMTAIARTLMLTPMFTPMLCDYRPGSLRSRLTERTCAAER